MGIQGSIRQFEIAITGVRTVRFGNTGPGRSKATKGQAAKIYQRRSPRDKETVKRVTGKRKSERITIRVSSRNAICIKTRRIEKMVHGHETDQRDNARRRKQSAITRYNERKDPRSKDIHTTGYERRLPSSTDTKRR